MSKLVISIEKKSNGYLVKGLYNDEYDDSIEEYVFSDELPTEVDAHIYMHRCLNELYGPQDSRYNAKRIHTFALPGDKFEGEITDKEYLEELEYYKERLTNILKRDK